MKQLVIFPKGTLTAKDKERMSKEGYIAIETDEPSRVVMPLPSSQFTQDEMLRCALFGIDKSGSSLAKQYFVEEITKLLRSKATK